MCERKNIELAYYNVNPAGTSDILGNFNAVDGGSLILLPNPQNNIRINQIRVFATCDAGGDIRISYSFIPAIQTNPSVVAKPSPRGVNNGSFSASSICIIGGNNYNDYISPENGIACIGLSLLSLTTNVSNLPASTLLNVNITIEVTFIRDNF